MGQECETLNAAVSADNTGPLPGFAITEYNSLSAACVLTPLIHPGTVMSLLSYYKLGECVL